MQISDGLAKEIACAIGSRMTTAECLGLSDNMRLKGAVPENNIFMKALSEREVDLIVAHLGQVITQVVLDAKDGARNLGIIFAMIPASVPPAGSTVGSIFNILENSPDEAIRREAAEALLQTQQSGC